MNFIKDIGIKIENLFVKSNILFKYIKDNCPGIKLVYSSIAKRIINRKIQRYKKYKILSENDFIDIKILMILEAIFSSFCIYVKKYNKKNRYMHEHLL